MLLSPAGTPFQHRVWEAIVAISQRESRTYGEIARNVRSALRAIGQACGANRIALIIPCHRVVGTRGALGGFLGVGSEVNGRPGRSWRRNPERPAPSIIGDIDALAVKRWLLTHEGYRFGA